MEQNPLKLNLEYHKRGLSFGIIIFSSLAFIVTLIVACLASPDIIGSSSLKFIECSSSQNSNCIDKNEVISNFILSIGLEKYNQILYLESSFESKQKINENLDYKLVIYAKNEDDKNIETKKNQTLEMYCNDGICDSQMIFYIPYIEYDTYIAKITVYGNIPVDSIEFSIKFITKEFTTFFLGTKYFFLACSGIALVFFVYSLFRVKFSHWPRQSKIMGLMLISLFIFNEPLLAVTLNKLEAEWSGVSVFCNCQFAALLILFLFLILQDNLPDTKWMIAVTLESIFIFIFFVLICVFYMFTTVQLKYDPTFSWTEDLPTVQRSVFISALTFLVILAIWMTVLIVYSIMRFWSKLWRDRILTITVYIMIIISFLLIGIGAFQPLPRSGTILLVSVSLFNIYFITLSWLFSPNRMSYLEFSLEIDAGKPENQADNYELRFKENLDGTILNAGDNRA